MKTNKKTIKVLSPNDVVDLFGNALFEFSDLAMNPSDEVYGATEFAIAELRRGDGEARIFLTATVDPKSDVDLEKGLWYYDRDDGWTHDD